VKSLFGIVAYFFGPPCSLVLKLFLVQELNIDRDRTEAVDGTPAQATRT